MHLQIMQTVAPHEAPCYEGERLLPQNIPDTIILPKAFTFAGAVRGRQKPVGMKPYKMPNQVYIGKLSSTLRTSS